MRRKKHRWISAARADPNLPVNPFRKCVSGLDRTTRTTNVAAHGLYETVQGTPGSRDGIGVEVRLPRNPTGSCRTRSCCVSVNYKSPGPGLLHSKPSWRTSAYGLWRSKINSQILFTIKTMTAMIIIVPTIPYPNISVLLVYPSRRRSAPE